MPVVDSKVGSVLEVVRQRKVDDEPHDAGTEEVPEVYADEEQEHIGHSEPHSVTTIG